MISHDSTTPFRTTFHPASREDEFQSAPSKTIPLAAQPAAIVPEQSAEKPVATPAPSRLSPWLLSLAYPIGRYGLMPLYFKQIEVVGRENLPLSGPVILAPTHRSRWDAFMAPYAAGRDITGRNLRFMVSADEMEGLQGWFIRRMGGFPINTKHPAIASLRHGVDLLRQGEMLVIFPEGNIFRELAVQPLKPGLARLSVQAELSQAGLGVQVVPICTTYSHPTVPWRSSVKIQIGTPLRVADYLSGSCKTNAQRLTTDLQSAMEKCCTQVSL